jgi:N-acetylglutamate synthase-like GNAT family acetyltransferase
MKFRKISPEEELDSMVKVLNESHLTVAKEFRFNRQNNPSNNAFIEAGTLQTQIKKSIDLFAMEIDNNIIGCIAIERSPNHSETFFIEKVSIIPRERHKGYGEKMMKFAEGKIKEMQGRKVSVALIDTNYKLKHWYELQGYNETCVRDFPHLPFNVCFMEKKL